MGLRRADRKACVPDRASLRPSASRLASSKSFSRRDSQLASRGRSSSTKKATIPIAIGNIPSIRNSHCQILQSKQTAEVLHDHPRSRTSDHPRYRDGENEVRHDPPAHAVRKPEREVKNDAREEPGFGSAEQDADQIELKWI